MTLTWKRTALLLCAFVTVAVAVVAHQFRWTEQHSKWPEQSDPVNHVSVELQPARQVIKVGTLPDVKVTLVNNGNKEVTLVKPGDGSEIGWRTPIIEWSAVDRHSIRMCGNINPLQPGEVFKLLPGERKDLSEWLGFPYVSAPGRYTVALKYTNDPKHVWGGVPLRSHDLDAMRAVRQSTPVTAVSNTIEIIVER
jgi:hypothetical protein